ncbi:MAG: hypothetical protein GX829_09675 [Clostridium sp.]|jgi:hypothetical protein|nr:hypothetical protein [Clostridium sp.]
MDYILRDPFLSIILIMGLAVVGIFFYILKNKTPFQKINRFTILAVMLTLLGLLSLNFSLLNSLIGSLLVLLLIRISYVIYVDSE